MMKSQRSFRSDVEGMRALAVLAILGFHFQWGSVFDGGFVGVDIFFVISGFLITGNLLRENDASGFTFGGFYLRRIRRLFPALFAAVAAILLCGIAFSSPADLSSLAESALASIFSVANVYFWSKSGYFDAAAIQKPLLHIWSLSVEEQFYLVWPALLFLAYKFGKRAWLPALLAAIVIAGVATAEVQISLDPSTAFFLTPFRVNEFALGAICAVLPPLANSKIHKEILSLAGLALVLYSIVVFTEQTRFPGLASMIPCGGAALLIYANGGVIARLILTNPVAAYLGRISYSLYLVHWPIAVFVFQSRGSGLDGKEKLAMTAASLVLTVPMYYFVEQPFRTNAKSVRLRFSNSVFARLFVSLVCAAVLLSVAIIAGKGWPSRYSANSVRIAADVDAEKKMRFATYRQRCSKGQCSAPGAGGNVFLFGDSHAADILNAMVSAYPQFHYVYQELAGCPILAREDDGILGPAHPNRAECLALNEKRLYGSQLKSADIIIVNLLFGWYRPEHLANAIAAIRKQTSAPIVVMGNYMVFDDDFPNMVIQHGQLLMDGYYQKRMSKLSFAYDDELAALARRMNFTFISKRQALCRNESIMSCPIAFDGKLYTYDKHHLSRAAALALGQVLKQRYGYLFSRVRIAAGAPAPLATDVPVPAPIPARAAAPSQGSGLWFEPAGLSVCAGPARVTVHWNASPYADVESINIYAINKDGKEVLFARAGRTGSHDTGEWMLAGRRMILRNQAGGAELASATVASIPCQK